MLVAHFPRVPTAHETVVVSRREHWGDEILTCSGNIDSMIAFWPKTER